MLVHLSRIWVCLQAVKVEGNMVNALIAGDEGEEYGFDRGSKRSYELEVGDPLGTLRSIFVQQVFCNPTMQYFTATWNPWSLSTQLI